jgi:hypothetical protein
VTTAPQPTKEVEAYASASSVESGGTISFHVRVQGGCICQMIVKQHTTGELLFEDEFYVEVFLRNSLDADGANHGCNWPVAYELKIPLSWKSNLYLAEFTVGSSKSIVPIVVRSSIPGSSILLKVADTTAQAYNPWGGQSLYNRDPIARSVQISFDRPWTLVGHKYDFWYFDMRFLEWCHKRNIVVDVCSSIDIHAGTVDLNKYNLMVSIGHDEYWSKETRDNVEGFFQKGGHVCFLGANTCFWQVRFDRNGRQMIGYKELASKDPMVLQDPSRVTGQWGHEPTNRPENLMTLGSYLNGAGWWDVIPEGDLERRWGKTYCVSRPNHWVFEGTDLPLNGTFGTTKNQMGAPDTIMGHETDSAKYVITEAGIPVVTGEDGTPIDTVILAYCDLTDWPGATKNGQSGHATMSVRELFNGGVIFSAGTVNWGGALTDDDSNIVDRITANLIHRLKEPGNVLPVRVDLSTTDNNDKCFAV